MTTKEASQKWNISEKKIGEFCRKEMVYKAVKLSGKWVIPEEAEKPLPVNEIKAILYLVIIAKFKPQSVDISTVAWDYEDFREKCRYLHQMAYISDIDGVSDERLLIGINLTNKGLSLFYEKEFAEISPYYILEVISKLLPIISAISNGLKVLNS